MLTLIIVLSITGTLALVLEVFLPGGILGVAGGLSIAAAIALTLTSSSLGELSLMARLGICALIIALAITTFTLTLTRFNRTRLGKLITLESTVAGTAQPTIPDLAVGQIATATGDLTPLGTIAVDAHPMDALSESGYVPSGSKVRVTRIESGTVYVVAA